MAFLAAERGWSVRELERQITQTAKGKLPAAARARTDPDVYREQTLWSEQLGAEVKLRYWNNGKVRITITASSLDEYQGIRERLLPAEE